MSLNIGCTFLKSLQKFAPMNGFDAAKIHIIDLVNVRIHQPGACQSTKIVATVSHRSIKNVI